MYIKGYYQQSEKATYSRWMNKMWFYIVYTHTIEYYLTLKKDFDICYSIDKSWRHHLNEISQLHEDRYCVIPLIMRFLRVVKIIEPESSMVVSRGCGKEVSRMLAFNGHRVSARENEKVLERDEGWLVMAVQQREHTWFYRTIHLKMVKRVINFMLCIFYHYKKCEWEKI